MLLPANCCCGVEIYFVVLGAHVAPVATPVIAFQRFCIAALHIIVQRVWVEDHVGGRKRGLAAVGVEGGRREDQLVAIREVVAMLDILRGWILSMLLMPPTRLPRSCAFVIGAQPVLNLRERFLVLVVG